MSRRDYSVKPWTDYFEKDEMLAVGKNTFSLYRCGSSGPLILFLHGGGFSGLSWALLAKNLTSSVDCQCIALDFRGHGNTQTEDDLDLSADTLASDVCDVVEALDLDERVILIGHSMGGAIAVRAAAQNRIHSLAALIVIDVVEGTALESLPAMHGVLQSRPQMFRSPEKAVEWWVTPAQPFRYEWRIDLSKTEKYWKGWFTGLSSLFLSVPVPKILMLAGVNALDRDLTIGQMQGKFQMQILPKSGHAVHEDCPLQVAQAISAFLTRHKLAQLKPGGR